MIWKFSAVAVCDRMNGPRSLSTRYPTRAGIQLNRMPPMWIRVAQSFSSAGLSDCA